MKEALWRAGETVALAAVGGATVGLSLFALMWLAAHRVERRRARGLPLDRRGRPREDDGLSLVRLDPKVLEMRAYPVLVDTGVPLRKMVLPFIVNGLVTIIGDKAVISMVMAREHAGITRPAYRALRQKLRRDYGISRVEWERHDENGDVRAVEGPV